METTHHLTIPTGLSEQEFDQLKRFILEHHTYRADPGKCSSLLAQRIHAPIETIWSILRRFDKPQTYKHFIRSCHVKDDFDLAVGSTRDVNVISGLPAETSTERLDILDDEKYVTGFSIIGGEHRLKGYKSVTTVNELNDDGKIWAVVLESYVVEVPEGNSEEDTKLFADTVVRLNLQKLASVAEGFARGDVTDSMLCLVKYQEVSAVLRLTHFMDFNDVTTFIAKRWPDLMNRLSLGYVIPNVSSFCELTCQQDYVNMFDILSVNCVKHIEIIVHKVVGESSRVRDRESDSFSGGFSGASTEVTSNNQPAHDLIEDNSPILLTYRWRNCITGINQLFPCGASEFRNALNKFSLFKRFSYVFKKNHARKVVAVCKYKSSHGCEWKIHGCGDGSGSILFIKKYISEHTCGPDAMTRTITRAHSDIVAEIVEEKMRTKPLYRAIDCKTDIEREYGLEISYDNAWSGIEKARSNLYGEYKYSYHQLWFFCEAIKSSNPGSHIVFEVDAENRFKRLFFSFKACIDGFAYCRPMLFVDSTFLTGRYRGQMFAATAKDANNNLYPLAYGVVDSENKDNWYWFMIQLKCILNTDRRVVFISDRNEGLLHGVSSVFPDSPHGYCTAHLKNNMKVHMSKLPAGAKESIFQLFDCVIYANTADYFHRKMAQLKQVCGVKISAMLDSIDPTHYSNCFFPGYRYNETSSNAAESLNNKYKEERQLSLYGLVDKIRIRLMKDMTTKRDNSRKWKSHITPAIDTIITERINVGSTWFAVKVSDSQYEVMAKRSVTVNLDSHTCSCYAWQITRLPCAHALSAILKSKRPVTDFLDRYYLTSTYQDTYSFNIMSVSTLELPRVTASTCTIFPPKSRSQPGRRKNNRIRSVGEFVKPKRKFKCSRCNKLGHNRMSCRESC